MKPEKPILHICDFRRGVFNVRLYARIQHLLLGHKYGLFYSQVASPSLCKTEFTSSKLHVILKKIEEILFRGVMLNKLRTYGDKIAIITTALLFGLFHENFSQFFYAVGLGVVFAYVTLKTGTIKYSIGLHIMINMMGSVIGTQVLNSTIATMIFGIVVWVFVIAGLILFIKDFKKMSLLPGEVTIEKGYVVSETWLNMGMMINLIISLSLMIYILLV